MRYIDPNTVRSELVKLITESLTVPDKSVTAALKNLATPVALERTAAQLIVENNEIAEREKLLSRHGSSAVLCKARRRGKLFGAYRRHTDRSSRRIYDRAQVGCRSPDQI